MKKLEPSIAKERVAELPDWRYDERKGAITRSPSAISAAFGS
jgi:hypothetical protein